MEMLPPGAVRRGAVPRVRPSVLLSAQGENATGSQLGYVRPSLSDLPTDWLEIVVSDSTNSAT